jgi:hypothetical protein
MLFLLGAAHAHAHDVVEWVGGTAYLPREKLLFVFADVTHSVIIMSYLLNGCEFTKIETGVANSR